jgi:uncharacterized membrane protein YbhN (UPF0104 family)
VARTAGIRLLQVVLTVAVTWFILRSVGVSAREVAALSPVAWRPRWGLLLLASLLLLVGYLISGGLWGVMVRQLGGPRLGLFRSCQVFLLANLGRYVPGKIWQIAGLAYLSRKEGVSARLATAAALVGQGTALAGATLVGASALLGPPGGQSALGRIVLWGALGLVVLLSLPPVFRRTVDLAFKLGRLDAPERLREDVTFGVRWVASYAFNWAVYAVAFWVLLRSFGLPGSLLEVGPGFAAAYVLGYLAVFAPAGIGVREGFLVVFLQPALGAFALGAAIVARLWTTVVELVPALVLALARVPAGGEEGRES